MFLFLHNRSWNQAKEESLVGPEPECKINTEIWDVHTVLRKLQAHRAVKLMEFESSYTGRKKG